MDILKILVPVLVALVGWGVVHELNLKSDKKFRQREVRLEYLVTAYRNLEQGINRERKTEEQNFAFESAIADIQLLGTPEQVKLIKEFSVAHAAGNKGNMEAVLESLRNDLRQEIGLQELEIDFFTLRFDRDT